MRLLAFVGLAGCANCFIHGRPELRKRLSFRLGSLRRKAASTATRTLEESAHSTPRRLCDDVEKPLIDSKNYRVVELSNGLRCCLISDPNTEISGAAMDIHAGSYQDPPEFAGLAHFHEHMLFLGTEKYPGEDAYESYLSANGGSCNAFTADEQTNYYFDVTAPYLEGALDRFAQFFLCPSFNLEMVGREVKAIDSEHRNNVPEDAWRWQQVFKQGLRPGHPACGFATGNLDTLLGEQSGALGDPTKLHAALLEFHEQWYTGPQMALCVLGKEPLDLLEAMVLGAFNQVRPGQGTARDDSSKVAEATAKTAAMDPSASIRTNGGITSVIVRKDAPLFTYGHQGPYGSGSKVGIVRRIVPVADLRELSLTFPLAGPTDKAQKPHRYWSHVLGHEGEGSLHAVLQAAGLVEDLSAGLDLRHDDGAAFRLAMTLTELGEENLNEVLDTTFLYLALVRAAGVSSAVMDELASLSDVSFAYQEDSGGVANQVSRVASNLLEYEPKNVLSGPSMTLSPTQHASTVNSAAPHAAKVDDTVHATVESDSTTEMDAVLDIGHAFTPANTIITVALKSFAETAAEKTTSSSPNDQWQTEPWYGTLYREEPISPESLHRWQYAEEAEAQQRQNQEQQSDSPATNDSQDSTRVAAIVGGTRVWLRPVPLLNRFMPTAEMSKVAALTTKRADLVDLSSVASRGIDADTAAPGGNEERDVNVVSENESVEEEVPGVVRATRVVSGSENRRLAAWRVSPSKHLLGVPRLHATVHLLTPHAAGSPRQVVLAKLFCRLLLSDTNTALYDASCAGLAYDVTSTSDGLVVNAYGFESQVPRLLNALLARAYSLAHALDESDGLTKPLPDAAEGGGKGLGKDAGLADLQVRFETQVELLAVDLENAALDSAYSQAVYWLRQCVEARVWHVSEYLAVLESAFDEEEDGDNDGDGMDKGASEGVRRKEFVRSEEESGELGCELKDVLEAGKVLLATARAEVLLTGNLTDQEAAEVARRVLAELPAQTAHASGGALRTENDNSNSNDDDDDDNKVPLPRAVQLPLVRKLATGNVPAAPAAADDDVKNTAEIPVTPGPLLCRTLPDTTNENSCALQFLHFGLEATVNGGASGASEKEGEEEERLSTAEHACLELIGHLAAPSFFQKLRTEEQLGYLVSAHVSRFSGALGLTLLVQSSTAAPRHLEARMTSWCHSFAQELEALSEEACAANALALATQYTERPRSLGDEHDSALGELLSRRYAFNRRAARADAVLKVTKAELLEAWHERLSPSAPQRRPLRVHTYARAHAAEAGLNEGTVNDGSDNDGVDLSTLEAVRAFKDKLPQLMSPSVHCD